MGYRENATELAAKWGLENPPKDGIDIDKVQIAELVFIRVDGREVPVRLTTMNKVGMLFVQSLAASPNGFNRFDRLELTLIHRTKATEFFAERWDLRDPENCESQTVLWGLQFAARVHIRWKSRVGD